MKSCTLPTTTAPHGEATRVSPFRSRVARLGAIGGATRVIVMEGPRGGHAYTEACIHEEPTTVATKLARFYGRAWARYAPGGRRQIGTA
mgnify:CR=1 FL=1